MFTVLASPSHVLPVSLQMPTLKDELGGGAQQLRRRQTRALGRWELLVPGVAQKLDPIIGLLEYIQGDTPIWFDGAGYGEITEPSLIGFGDGSTTDFPLPHRHVFVSSIVVYKNGEIDPSWLPLGAGIVCDAIRFSPAPSANSQITGKYRRKIKAVLQTEQDVGQERSFRNIDDPLRTIQRLKYFLQEVPF